MARRLAGTVIINGTDDESWPQSNEHTNRVFNIDRSYALYKSSQVCVNEIA